MVYHLFWREVWRHRLNFTAIAEQSFQPATKGAGSFRFSRPRIDPGFVAGIAAYQGKTGIDKMSQAERLGNQDLWNDKITHATDGC